MGTVYEYGNHFNDDSNINCNTRCLIYRGTALGNVSINNIDKFISSHNIQEGYFTDLYVGDYFTAKYSGSIITFRIMDIDPYWGISASGIADKHHILIVPDKILTTSYMNSSSTNSTGYYGSYMFNTTIPTIDANLEAIFGDHLLSYNEIVCTDNSTGTTTATVKSILMNEIEIFGERLYSTKSSGMISQLLGFAQNSDLKKTYNTNGVSVYYWLRECRYSNTFCFVCSDGTADYDYGYYASSSSGVRPRFLLG